MKERKDSNAFKCLASSALIRLAKYLKGVIKRALQNCTLVAMTLRKLIHMFTATMSSNLNHSFCPKEIPGHPNMIRFHFINNTSCHISNMIRFHISNMIKPMLQGKSLHLDLALTLYFYGYCSLIERICSL